MITVSNPSGISFATLIPVEADQERLVVMAMEPTADVLWERSSRDTVTRSIGSQKTVFSSHPIILNAYRNRLSVLPGDDYGIPLSQYRAKEKTEILEALDQNDVVVVAGPPGGGKQFVVDEIRSQGVEKGAIVLLDCHREEEVFPILAANGISLGATIVYFHPKPFNSQQRDDAREQELNLTWIPLGSLSGSALTFLEDPRPQDFDPKAFLVEYDENPILYTLVMVRDRHPESVSCPPLLSTQGISLDRYQTVSAWFERLQDILGLTQNQLKWMMVSLLHGKDHGLSGAGFREPESVVNAMRLVLMMYLYDAAEKNIRYPELRVRSEDPFFKRVAFLYAGDISDIIVHGPWFYDKEFPHTIFEMGRRSSELAGETDFVDKVIPLMARHIQRKKIPKKLQPLFDFLEGDPF